MKQRGSLWPGSRAEGRRGLQLLQRHLDGQDEDEHRHWDLRGKPEGAVKHVGDEGQHILQPDAQMHARNVNQPGALRSRAFLKNVCAGPARDLA